MRSARQRGQQLFWLLSLLVAVSMVCSTILFVVELREPTRPTETPTVAVFPPTATFTPVFTHTLPPTAAKQATATPTPSIGAATAPPTATLPTITEIPSPTATPKT